LLFSSGGLPPVTPYIESVIDCRCIAVPLDRLLIWFRVLLMGIIRLVMESLVVSTVTFALSSFFTVVVVENGYNSGSCVVVR
jgi:hypothetical protein